MFFETTIGIFIVECKTTLSTISKYLNDKWRNYIELSKIKKNVLEEYCKYNGFKSFWYIKTMNKKFYDSI